MIRKLYERSFAIQKQMLLSYLARSVIYQSNSFRTFTPSSVIPVPYIQRSFNSLECDKKLDAKLETNDEIIPTVVDLQKKLKFSTSEAEELHEFLTINCDTINSEDVIKTVKWLKKIGASPSVIVKNCHISLIPLDKLKKTYGRLNRCEWKTVDDFVPLLPISESQIQNIQIHVNHSISDWIYLFNEYSSIEPHIISHYCSKYFSVFRIELESLKRKLNMLLSHNVSPENIVRHLGVLKYTEDAIEEHLDYLKQCGIEHIMPWMITCSPDQLQKAIKIRKNLKAYDILTKRLHWNGKTAISMFSKNEFLKDLNSETAAELLDEWEKIFTPSEISANIDLLSYPISHVRILVAELKTNSKVYEGPRILDIGDKISKQYLNSSKHEVETRDEINPTVIELQKELDFSKSEAIELYEFLSANCDKINLHVAIKIVKWLKEVGATSSVILKNSHILLIPSNRLKRSYERLNRSKWRKVDDFVPLLAISEPKIKNIQMHAIHLIRDRIYLFNEYFSIEPHIISQYCSKQNFVFEIELELLKRKLNMLLSHNVSPENILRNLTVFTCSEDIMKERLSYLKLCGIEHIMPWMIKCQDHVLHKSIKMREKLGVEQKKTFELLTKRLHWHGHTAISMFSKNEFLRDRSPATASELLDELGKTFSPIQITANIELLSYPISDIKMRVAELISVKGQVSPEILGMSEKSFKEYLSVYKKCVELITYKMINSTPTHGGNVTEEIYLNRPCKLQLEMGQLLEPSGKINPTVVELQKELELSGSEAKEVYEFLSANCDTINLEEIIGVVNWLKEVGATSSVIVKNCHILLIPLDRLKKSYERLNRSEWKTVDDFVPLLVVSEYKNENILVHVNHSIRDRIYLFNEYLKIEPHVISHYCSKQMFVFKIESESLKRKLDMLLSHNVSPENILRHLNVLTRSEGAIQERLRYLKQCGIEHITTWMITYSDRRLQKAIETRTNFKAYEILSNRLQWSGRKTASMFSKNEFLRELNSATASELLDELEKIFTSSEISANIELLSHPVSYVKSRVAKLISLKGNVSPKVIGMSEKSFEQYLNCNNQ